MKVLLFLLMIAYCNCVRFTNDDIQFLGCYSNSMYIEISTHKMGIHGREFQMHFKGYYGDEECSIESGKEFMDYDYYYLGHYFNFCGIQQFTRGNKVIYNQTIYLTFGKDPASTLVHRTERITIDFECVLDKDAKVKLLGPGHVNVSSLEPQSFEKADVGKFDIKLVRTTSDTFSTEDSSSQMRLGDQMYFKLQFDTVRDDLKISPKTCYASRAKNSSDKYILVENGCPNKRDGTVKITENKNQKVFEWKNEAFRFFGDSDAVYITCDVIVCKSSDMAAECNRCDANKRRRRRYVATSSHKAARLMVTDGVEYYLV